MSQRCVHLLYRGAYFFGQTAAHATQVCTCFVNKPAPCCITFPSQQLALLLHYGNQRSIHNYHSINTPRFVRPKISNRQVGSNVSPTCKRDDDRLLLAYVLALQIPALCGASSICATAISSGLPGLLMIGCRRCAWTQSRGSV